MFKVDMLVKYKSSNSIHSKVLMLVIVPVGTGRKLNVHKTFRGHPGRLLNVLCTFNLRPVPTGVWVMVNLQKQSSIDAL